jgi:UDPglucose--hexose-1-phosphate uridylyltransferase
MSAPLFVQPTQYAVREMHMPEIRQNIATGEWVIIATERAKRPEEFVQPDKERVVDRPAYAASCPFCPGNEELDLERLRLPAQGPWRLRVVQNRYPALAEQGARDEYCDGANYSIAGVGYHEIIVESRLHNTAPALEPADDIERTLRAFRLRGLTLRKDARIQHIVFFKNHGHSAGASLLHPHTQLLALPVIPSNILDRTMAAWRYFDDHGVCVFCRMLEEEQRQRVRIVAESPHFVAFVPYAAYSPFHVWILPRRHGDCFLEARSEELRDLSQLLHDVLRRLHFGLNDPDYNYVIRTAPERERGEAYLHWYLAIVPRMARVAGFELGSGMFINTALPEASAEFLRAVQLPRSDV